MKRKEVLAKKEEVFDEEADFDTEEVDGLFEGLSSTSD